MHSRLASGKKLEGYSRFDEQAQVLDEICEITKTEQPDAVLIAGDCIDTLFPPSSNMMERAISVGQMLLTSSHFFAQVQISSLVAFGGNKVFNLFG